MNGEQIGYVMGWVGGILGIVFGCGGAFLGTYIPYRLAKTKRQKSFILKSAALLLAFILMFQLALALAPAPWNYFLWIPYVVFLVGFIAVMNRRMQRIYEQEAAAEKELIGRGSP